MSDQPPELTKLRAEIDRIDRAMHDLLMERGRMISALQTAKGIGAQKGSGAMRPAREASMMAAIADRHAGPLSLSVAERIWREIIAAFTQLQAGFDVYTAGPDEVALAEMTRFYFGVTTKITRLDNAVDVINKTQGDDRAVGFIAGPIDAGTGPPWWAKLARVPDRRARIVARYPFLGGAGDAPWGVESWIISQAPFEASGNDCTLIAAFEAGRDAFDAAWAEVDRTVIDGDMMALMRIDEFVDPDGLLDRCPSQLKVEHLGGYARSGRKMDTIGAEHDG